MKVATLGYGEVGRAFAQGPESAGARVTAFARSVRKESSSVTMDPVKAVHGADLVLSVVTPASAVDVAETVRDHLKLGSHRIRIARHACPEGHL